MKSVDEFLARLCRAWDAGDAEAYGSLFAEDASYVIFLGDVLRGREEIVSTHREVFAKWQKGTRMRVEAIEVRPVHTGSDAPDPIVVVTAGGIGTRPLIRHDKLQTFVLRSHDSGLECVAFQNTEMSRRSKKKWNSTTW